MLTPAEIENVVKAYRAKLAHLPVQPVLAITVDPARPTPHLSSEEIERSQLIRCLRKHTAPGKTSPVFILHHVDKGYSGHWSAIFLSHSERGWNILFLDAAMDNEYIITNSAISHGLDGHGVNNYYVLAGGIQSDGRSCSLFALDQVTQLIDFTYRREMDIFAYIAESFTSQKIKPRSYDNFTFISMTQLPGGLIRLVQSRRALDKYKEANPTGAEEVVHVAIQQRSCLCGLWRLEDRRIETRLKDIPFQVAIERGHQITINPLLRRAQEHYRRAAAEQVLIAHLPAIPEETEREEAGTTGTGASKSVSAVAARGHFAETKPEAPSAVGLELPVIAELKQQAKEKGSRRVSPGTG